MHAELVPVTIPFPSGPPRTPGLHLSGLIRAMASDYGFLDKKWTEDLELIEVIGGGESWWNGLDEDSKIRMSIGLAWENWYLPQVPGVIHQPGELVLEGIYMTRDGESLEYVLSEGAINGRYAMACHEVKTTSKSINTVGDLNEWNPKNWMWLSSVRSYCKAMDTTLAFLHILFLCGDYSFPITPKLHVWKLEFEQAEIDETWEQVTSYRNAKVRV